MMDDCVHTLSGVAADAPEDILARESHWGWRVVECAVGDKRNLAIREILRICGCGGETDTLELATAAAS